VKVRALVLALGLAGCYDTGPHLDNAQPSSAHVGDSVLLNGANLCGDSGACAGASGAVDLGVNPPYIRMPVSSYGDDKITMVIPSSAAMAGKTKIFVTVGGSSSNAISFEVLPSATN
jgi:hypothetical protein